MKLKIWSTVLRYCLYDNHIEISQTTPKTYNYSMCCSVFAPYINLYSNTEYWINRWNDEVFKHIDLSIWECLKAWTLDLQKGWYYSENRDIVSKIRLGNYIEFNKDTKYFDNILDMWYMVQVWIKVNRKFIHDLKDDWKLNSINDYIEYTTNPNYFHTFNIEKTWDTYYINDSVFPVVHDTLVSFKDIEEFKKVMYPTCWIFI